MCPKSPLVFPDFLHLPGKAARSSEKTHFEDYTIAWYYASTIFGCYGPICPGFHLPPNRSVDIIGARNYVLGLTSAHSCH